MTRFFELTNRVQQASRNPAPPPPLSLSCRRAASAAREARHEMSEMKKKASVVGKPAESKAMVEVEGLGLILAPKDEVEPPASFRRKGYCTAETSSEREEEEEEESGGREKVAANTSILQTGLKYE